MSDPLEQSFDRFTMPGQIPDASDPAWRLPPVERDAVWRARGLLHPAGRGWAPVAGSSGPVPLPHPADGAAPHSADDYAPRPAPGKGPWPKGWLPGDPPVQYVDADALGAELEGDPAAASRQFDAAARVRFLDCLATLGEVRAAAARVGVSRETCYRARRRWRDFARLWDAALLHARPRAEGELASRAYDGIKVPVFLRGECVATYRRHDPRYLAMLLARLDRHAEECPEAAETAGRFDELLALHAGQATPEGFADAAGLWDERRRPRADDDAPRVPTRREYAAWYASEAIEGVEGEDEGLVMAEAQAEAEAIYDEWREDGLARVDAIVLGEGEDEARFPSPLAGEEGGASAPEGEGSAAQAAACAADPSPDRCQVKRPPDVSGHAGGMTDLAPPQGERAQEEAAEHPAPAEPVDPPYEVKSAPQHRVTGVNTPRHPFALRGTALAGSLGGFYCPTNPILAKARAS